MGSTLDFIVNKFNLDLSQPSPIQLPGVDRIVMAQTMAELGFKIGAEIGVAAGVHSEMLCEIIPDLTLYCIDPWRIGDGYREFGNSKLERLYGETQEKLAKYNCVIIRKFSMEIIGDFKDQSLDFVYLDGAHDFRHIAADISEWIKKVRPGGILYGHDFVTIPFGNHHCHVEDVVTAYANSHLIEHWFYYGVLQEHRLDGRFTNIPEWVFIC